MPVSGSALTFISFGDKVFNIAQNMWRKRRMATYRKERAEFGERVLRGGEKQIEQALKYPESPEAEKLSSDLRLPVPKRDHFERTLPREKFRSDAAYREVIAEAVVRWFCGHKIITGRVGHRRTPRR